MSKPRIKRVHVVSCLPLAMFTLNYWTWKCSDHRGVGYGATPWDAYDEWFKDVPKTWPAWVWRKAIEKAGWSAT